MGILLQSLFDEPGNRYLLIGVATLTILYVVVRPLLKRKKDPLDRSPRLGMGLSQQRSVEREMSNVLVELSEMSRQVSAQLDSRAAKLELLIQQADERLAALEAARRGSPPPDRPNQPDEARAGRAESPLPPDPRHLEVYELADQGRSCHEIADQLSRPSGEIELILALRPRN